MAEADQDGINPYVGPRPFEPAERSNFFGRDNELQELVSLVISHRVVLLYAASGAGKTSLLVAGLVPALEQRGFEVLPPARVRGLLEDEARMEHAGNIYTLGVISHWADDGTISAPIRVGAGGSKVRLAEFLGTRRKAVTEEGRPAPVAVVVDQFEELFTLYPERWEERRGFVEELAEALDDDPLLRVLLSIREDYLAHLDPYAQMLPGALRARFRLERLGRDPALRAVTGPVRDTRRSYAPGVAERLVENLIRVRVDTGIGQIVEVDGEYVEPVQLQVACRSLWSSLPPDVSEITEEHRLTFGDVDRVLSDFYDEAIAAAASRARKKEDRLRARLEETLITPMGTRSTVFEADGAAGKIPAAAVEELEDRHLIRAELRAGARWYELTHDRLIEPIRTSNRRRFDRARKRRNRILAALVVVLALLSAALVLSYFQFLRHGPTSLADHKSLIVDVKPIKLPSEATLFGPHGSQLFTLRGATAHLWALPSEREVVLHGHKGPIVAWDFSGTGRVITAGKDRTIRVWDSAGGKPLSVLHSRARIENVVSSLDGQLFVALSADGLARVWRTKDLTRVAALHVGRSDYPVAAFSPDDKLLVTGGGDTTAVWKLPSGRKAATLDTASFVEDVYFSPDDRHFVTTSGFDSTVWDARTNQPFYDLPEGFRAAYSSDGRRLVTAGGNDATVWDASSGRKIAVLRAGRDDATSVGFSPDRKYVVTGGEDGLGIWEASTGRLLAVLGFDPFTRAAFSPDGRLVMGQDAFDETATVWVFQQIRRQLAQRSR